MKIISGVVLVLLCLFISNLSFAQTIGQSINITMPESDIQIGDSLSFVEIESVIRDNYGVGNLSDLKGDGVQLKQDLATIYQQLILGTLSLDTKNVEFNIVELEDWSNETQGYKTRYLLSLSYDFTEDGVEYHKDIGFKYEITDNGLVKPILFSISEADINVMNPPNFYYFFEEDGVRFEEIF